MFTTYQALLPACPVRPAVKFPTDLPEDRKRAKREVTVALTGGFEEGARAMLHCNREHSWPELSVKACFFLTVAMDRIAEFLKLCYVETENGYVSLFPYMKQGDGELIQWMFFRWWIGPGIDDWLQKVVLDRKMFDSYFDSVS